MYHITLWVQSGHACDDGNNDVQHRNAFHVLEILEVQEAFSSFFQAITTLEKINQS